MRPIAYQGIRREACIRSAHLTTEYQVAVDNGAEHLSGLRVPAIGGHPQPPRHPKETRF